MNLTRSHALGFFLIFSFATIYSLISPGCANMLPPQGGPRDTLPPLLVSIDPRDSMTNFNDRTIVLTFDEYVQVENERINVIMTPTPVTPPKIEPRLRTITVKLRDTLEPNTTYVIDFGNAIRDINESNVLRGFSYIFTTGEALDSLEIEGNVLLAETGAVDTTLIVMLHRSGRDSAVSQENPRYVTRVDRNGHFHFRFLPAGTYYIYAMKDESNTRRYLGTPSQLFAFADSPVVIAPNRRAEAVTLYASAEKSQSSTPLLTQNRPGGTRGDDRRLRFFTSLNNQPQDLVKPFVLNFEVPLKNFDSTLARLSTDTTFTPVIDYRWEMDTSRKKITLIHTFRESMLYNLILDRDFAEDTAGRKLLKTDTINFNTRKRSDYASLRIRLRNVDLSRNPVLLFLQNEQVVQTIPITAETVTRQLFTPGEYGLRIVYDTNGNGKWDAGSFFGGRRQPEKILRIERTVNVRAGMENPFDIEAK